MSSSSSSSSRCSKLFLSTKFGGLPFTFLASASFTPFSTSLNIEPGCVKRVCRPYCSGGCMFDRRAPCSNRFAVPRYGFGAWPGPCLNHSVHWACDGPGYQDLQFVSDGCQGPLPPPPLPPGPFPLPLPLPLCSLPPPACLRGQLAAMCPISPHS